MQQAAKQEVNEIVISKPHALMDDLERVEYLADELDGYMQCPFPRLKLLAWVAAELALGKHTGPGAGSSLDNAYEDWISDNDSDA